MPVMTSHGVGYLLPIVLERHRSKRYCRGIHWVRGNGKFGNSTTPCLGTVMVFWRESLASGKGHVGFYVGEDDEAYQILGGNQSDKVCLMWLGKDRFRSALWTRTAFSLTSRVVQKDRDEGLSLNEA
ncbi:MAG: hypothetical protein ABL863_07020 [Nitrosomonas sp.]